MHCVDNSLSVSVTLMFWVNILKNPDFLLDVAKGATLDAALSVIAQVNRLEFQTEYIRS